MTAYYILYIYIYNNFVIELHIYNRNNTYIYNGTLLTGFIYNEEAQCTSHISRAQWL